MTMAKRSITIPKFRTEAEEAGWWDGHPEVATEIMRRAIKSGKAKRAVPLKTVTMRLPVPDIKAAQGLAEQPTDRRDPLHMRWFISTWCEHKRQAVRGTHYAEDSCAG